MRAGEQKCALAQRAINSVQPVFQQYLHALTAIANGDPEPLKALNSHREDISQCGLWGGVERGWEEVSGRLDWVAEQFVPGPGMVTADVVLTSETGEMAYTVWIERWGCQLKAQSEPQEMMIRVTLIFRREDGAWKAVHRHGDDRIGQAPL
jgi:ketosteroid isomerase-like protein